MGEDVGLTAPIPPTPRDYYALKACRNCRKETCGRFRAAENPRLGPGVDVAGPRPAATSRRARGLAGFLAKRGHMVRRRQVAGPWLGAPNQKFWSRRAGARQCVHRAAGRPLAACEPRGLSWLKSLPAHARDGTSPQGGARHAHARAQARILCGPKPPACLPAAVSARF